MKILFIRETELPELSPKIMAEKGLAGTENSVVCLAEELSKEHTVKVYCPVPEKTWYGKVEYRPLTSRGEISIFSAMFNPDIIIVAGNPTILFTDSLISKKLIFWQQNHPSELEGRFNIKELLMKPWLTVIAPSPEASEFYRNYYKTSFPQRIQGIYNGVRSEFFEATGNPEKGHITYCGSFTRAKGLSIVLEAAKRLPEYRFNLCGSFDLYGFRDTPYENLCKALAEGSTNITFAGSLNGEKLAEAMSTSELCIVNPLTLNHETCCVSALEAMATGTPVVAGHSLIIDPIIARGGIPYDGTFEALVTLIRALMNDPASRRKLGYSGRKFAGTLTWPEIGKQWVNLFEGLSPIS
jgi:glycosyltransferase involved in cell wall biosynthesis